MAVNSTGGSSRLISNKRKISTKKTDYLDWDEYFMALAFLAAKRSKDPSTQVGACLVDNENRIVSLGYNGMPRGCSDDEFPWGKAPGLDSKYLYVCHAEVNAILNRNSQDVKGCVLYVGLFPCNECAKTIIQSGIKSVVYMSDKHAHKVSTIAAKRLFDAAKIDYRQFIPECEKIEINFQDINWNNMNQMPAMQSPMKISKSPVQDDEGNRDRPVLRKDNIAEISNKYGDQSDW